MDNDIAFGEDTQRLADALVGISDDAWTFMLSRVLSFTDLALSRKGRSLIVIAALTNFAAMIIEKLRAESKRSHEPKGDN